VGRLHAAWGRSSASRTIARWPATRSSGAPLLNSIVFVVVRTPLEVGLGFLLALLLNRRLAARSLLRTLFFVPVVMSLIVVTIIFQRVYEPNTGLLNTCLTAVGPGRLGASVAGRPATALPAVIAVSVWKNVGSAW
jgi:ABC-type sugar transport system permease subunit